MGKVIIFSAPSGSGKTTIVRHLLERYPQFEFSISATSRAPRGQERDGVDYYFLSHGEFMQAVAENRFVEWEEVYKGTCYGTLRSEIEGRMKLGIPVILVIEVEGAGNIKKMYPGATTIFVLPPDMQELERRLRCRGTEDEETAPPETCRDRDCELRQL